MNNFRVFLAIVTFIISSYFIVDLIISSFDWLLLFISIVGFACSHYLWPPKYDKDSSWYDVLEVFVDFPFRAISLFIRGLGKIFKDTGSGLDF